MEQNLANGFRSLYATRRESPHDIRARIRLCDQIDRSVFRNAVDQTMRRYPYFCVELQKRDEQYVFVKNTRPVVIGDSLHGVELNSKESNYHMISFSCKDDWIIMDVFHGLTDANGAYEVIRTLMYYYCSKRYQAELKKDGIRLVGDEIPDEEWTDPTETVSGLPDSKPGEMSPALNLSALPGLQNDQVQTVYNVVIPESEFMRFNVANDGSPGTLVSLFLSRAIAKLNPGIEAPIRIILCVNQRKALRAPLAHQSLVGFAALEFKEQMRNWPIERQATSYRGMVILQTQDEAVLAGVNEANEFTKMQLSKKTDQERLEMTAAFDNMTNQMMSAVVSYVGKTDFNGAETYIRDFRAWTTCPKNGILVEMSAINGKFFLDFIQPYSDPVYVNAFMQQLKENGISCQLQDKMQLELVNIRLPWSE